MYKHKFCPSHPNEKIQMFCSTCDTIVCHKCISGPHTKHQFHEIDEVVHEKQDQLKQGMVEMEDIVSTFIVALSSVRTNHMSYSREIHTLTNTVIQKREEWKKQIDEIADTVLVQMRTTAEKDLEELKERKDNLSKNLMEIQEFLNSCRQKSKSTDALYIIKLAEDFKEEKKSHKSCPTPDIISPQHFVGKKIDFFHLREAFGQMEEDEAATSEFVASVNQGVKPNIDTTIIATIKSQVTCVSTVGDDNAWLGERGKDPKIVLKNKDGRLVHKKSFRFNFADHELTTTNTGNLLVTVMDNQLVEKYTKEGEYVNTILFTDPYYPQGICTTSDDEILVCLHEPSKFFSSDNKVIKLTQTGKVIQTIQYDKQNKPLFTDPRFVHENINRDVCVVDHWNALIVVNKDGELRFRYKSTHSTSIQWCHGIVCDRLGNILLSDHRIRNHRIHLIDFNGKFVQYVLDQQRPVIRPWGLSINNKGELWVCNDEKEVVVIKYRS